MSTSKSLSSLWMLVIGLCFFEAACDEPIGPQLIDPPQTKDTAAITHPASLVWAREVHSYDGFGEGITVQSVREGRSIAVLHNGDSLNYLFHLDTANGNVIDSFLVDAPRFGTGRIRDNIGGCVRLGDDYITYIGDWPFRLDLTNGVVKWLYPETLRPATMSADGSTFYAARFTDWDEAPAVFEIDAVNGLLVDSLIFADYPRGRRGGVGGIIDGPAFDGSGDQILYFDNGYITRDSITYGRSWLQAMRWHDKKVLWRRPLVEDQSANGRTPILYDSLLIRPDYDTIHAFDIRTGEEVWSYFAWEDLESTIGSRHFFDANPLVSSDGLVYFGSSNGDEPIFCLEAQSGQMIWQVSKSPGAGFGFQLIGDGMLAVAGISGGYTYLYDRHTGELLAKLPKVSNNGWIYAGVHYDSASRRVYGYDGARAYCYQLNFEPPGE